jgi:hypothetical protein
MTKLRWSRYDTNNVSLNTFKYTKFSFENLKELTWEADIYTEQTNVKMYVREIG